MLYSYVITRDYGFAPNPFGQYCTLATCKPVIRRTAQVDDWVIGSGSAAQGSEVPRRLVYAMQISEKLTFADYWADARFQYKKPAMNGSLKQKYGDNIYRPGEPNGVLVQVNSHHSNEGGAPNLKNHKTDIGGRYVLVSTRFWYFGRAALPVPNSLARCIIKEGMGHQRISDEALIQDFTHWLREYDVGMNGLPCLFGGGFKRYRGN